MNRGHHLGFLAVKNTSPFAIRSPRSRLPRADPRGVEFLRAPETPGVASLHTAAWCRCPIEIAKPVRYLGGNPEFSLMIFDDIVNIVVGW